MKKAVAVLATVLLSLAMSVQAFAQQQMPKGTEGPDIREREPKGTEGPDARTKAKKKSASAEAPASAGKSERKEPGVAMQVKKAGAALTESVAAEKVTGLVGTVVAVVPTSQTLVVDVPLGNDVLRIGADVTDKTKIQAGGQTVTLDKLEEGARVRIAFRRVEDGDEATSVEVLQGPKG